MKKTNSRVVLPAELVYFRVMSLPIEIEGGEYALFYLFLLLIQLVLFD